MWFRFISFLIFSFSSLINAQGQNFLGDTLAQGQQFVSVEVSMSDWYSGGDYVNNASTTGINDSLRGFSSANTKGYGAKTLLIYKYGLTQDISLGVKYGYNYQKNEMNIESFEGGAFTGDWIIEGGSDLSILGAYGLDESSSVDFFIDLPICSSEKLKGLCQNKLATPDNAIQMGESGAQGKGFYRFGMSLSSNWITEMDTHWMGSIFASAASSDKINGQKVTAPFTYGASFGSVSQIKLNHAWTGMLRLTRMFDYVSYSTQAQAKVKYNDHSRLAFTGEYLWDFMPNAQLRPFVEFAMVQLPTQSFNSEGQRRSIEFTSGTNVIIGLILNTTF
ncbi:MAG: hypothetical protein ACJAYK_000751 [Crocinitomicaceae bacterium]|jgi:hypothetical protein